MVHPTGLILAIYCALILNVVKLGVSVPTEPHKNYKDIEEEVRNEMLKITSAEKVENLIHMLTQEKYDHQKTKGAYEHAQERIINFAHEMGKLKEQKTEKKFHDFKIPPIEIKVKASKGSKIMDVSRR